MALFSEDFIFPTNFGPPMLAWAPQSNWAWICNVRSINKGTVMGEPTVDIPQKVNKLLYYYP